MEVLVSLPIRTTVDDVVAVCKYLATKPTGATLPEARAVVDNKHLDGRKLTALKFWGVIEDDSNGRIKITPEGRRAVMDSGAHQSSVLRGVIRGVSPYRAIVELVAHRGQETITSTDLAAHWYEHFRSDVSDSDKVLKDQAICFFHIAQAADLGELIIGRKGMQTRFDFDVTGARAFIGESAPPAELEPLTDGSSEVDDHEQPMDADPGSEGVDPTAREGNRVFITHGNNQKILSQVKELVAYGKYEPVVAIEQETSARPVPQKVMDGMRACKAAVIHVSAERVLVDADGNEVPQINENVLIEIGAAMALYGDKFVLLVEEGVQLPSNLQGLYECRYAGEELNMAAIMKLLKAFNEFQAT